MAKERKFHAQMLEEEGFQARFQYRIVLDNNPFIVEMRKPRHREKPLVQVHPAAQQQRGNYKPGLLRPPPPS